MSAGHQRHIFALQSPLPGDVGVPLTSFMRSMAVATVSLAMTLGARQPAIASRWA
ncbi:hypothetical protein ACIGKR_31055 [Rhodococcus qingshengii]|uniref:hypothetical protein n=1 Tax=Rhodococcus qingshengii TaxID=334542 RepID=UPI0037CB9CC0